MLMPSILLVLYAASVSQATQVDASPPSDTTDAVHLETSNTEDAAAPYVLVLGTAQDGGLPQIGCRRANCTAARAHEAQPRFVASLLIVDPRTGGRWLIDATPDIRKQTERARSHPPTRKEPGPRPALFDGIFLTHAHMGHYTGLMHLASPAYNAKDVPVYGSKRMCDFLSSNGPWDLMLQNGNIDVREVTPGKPVALGAQLSVTPILVPHRDEYTDTLGFIVRGPSRALLYIPDIDKWERWEKPVEEAIAAVDVTLLDGTFYADGELHGRSMAYIPHPFIAESLERFKELPAAERSKIIFTHLNHTNPATDPNSEAASRIAARGMGVAREGQRFGL